MDDSRPLPLNDAQTNPAPPVAIRPLTPADAKMLENNFTYHAPKPGQPQRYESLRHLAHTYAETILSYCPSSRERSLAITKLEEAVMWANAAIARNE